MLDMITSGNVRCLFQLGTPPQPYAVVEESLTEEIAVVRITPEIYSFFLAGGTPVCQPTMICPSELANLNVLCVFRVFIGAANTIPFAIVEAPSSNDIMVVQISEANFCFFEANGVPVCQIVDISGNPVTEPVCYTSE